MTHPGTQWLPTPIHHRRGCNLTGHGLPRRPAHPPRWPRGCGALPAWIGELTNLHTLELQSNQLRTLPAELVHLTRLRWLDLSASKMGPLPAWIGRLTSLQRLYFGGNQLTGLMQRLNALAEPRRSTKAQRRDLPRVNVSARQDPDRCKTQARVGSGERMSVEQHKQPIGTPPDTRGTLRQ